MTEINTNWTDWTVDCADPEVGIFADTIVHDPCVSEDGDFSPAEQDSVRIRPSKVEGIVEIVETFSCPTCGASISSVSQEPAEDVEYLHDEVSEE